MTLQNLALSHKKINSFTLEVQIFLEPQFLGNFTANGLLQRIESAVIAFH